MVWFALKNLVFALFMIAEDMLVYTAGGLGISKWLVIGLVILAFLFRNQIFGVIKAIYKRFIG